MKQSYLKFKKVAKQQEDKESLNYPSQEHIKKLKAQRKERHQAKNQRLHLLRDWVDPELDQ